MYSLEDIGWILQAMHSLWYYFIMVITRAATKPTRWLRLQKNNFWRLFSIEEKSKLQKECQFLFGHVSRLIQESTTSRLWLEAIKDINWKDCLVLQSNNLKVPWRRYRLSPLGDWKPSARDIGWILWVPTIEAAEDKRCFFIHRCCKLKVARIFGQQMGKSLRPPRSKEGTERNIVGNDTFVSSIHIPSSSS